MYSDDEMMLCIQSTCICTLISLFLSLSLSLCVRLSIQNELVSFSLSFFSHSTQYVNSML